MKNKKHTPEQIIRKLREVEALRAEGATAASAVKQIGVTEQTYYVWKRKYQGMDKKRLRELKALQKENERLKKLVAEQALDIDILKEAVEGK